VTSIVGPSLVRQARREEFALAAFNVFNLESLQAVVHAAEQSEAPVVVQVSPGAIDYAGLETLAAIAVRIADETQVPVAVHLDHCRDLDTLARAIDLGFGSVMFDGSALGFDENVRGTQRALELASATGAAVEAELGVIGGWEGSSLPKARAGATTPDEVSAFIRECPVDVLAPALGTLHRMPDEATDLDIDLVRRIASSAGVPLALHGGSGVVRASIPAAIRAGVAKVNLSSGVSRAFAAGIRDFWSVRPDEVDARRFLGAGRERVLSMAVDYFRLTGSAGRASTSRAVAAFRPVVEPE
jgi:ketose-bisphosphate aldolase